MARKTIDDSWIDDLEKNLQTAIKAVIEKNAQKVTQLAKAKCPVRTGTLQNSIMYKMSKDGKKAVIKTKATDDDGDNPAIYGRIVEFSPRINKPYMYPALAENKESFLQEITETLKKATRK